MKQPWQQQLRQQRQERFRRQLEELRQQQQEGIRQHQEHLRRQRQGWLRRQEMDAAWREQRRQERQARLGRWRQGAAPMKPRHPSSSREPRLRPGYRAGESPLYLERLARVFLYVLVIAAVLFLIGAGLGGGF